MPRRNTSWFVSKISVLRINFDESACTRCGRCSLRCKSSCIDFLKYDVDVSRCVDCFNCIHACQDKALSYGVVKFKKKEHKTDETRRKAVTGSVLLLLGLSAKSYGQDKKAPKPKKDSTVRENKTWPVCPPGGISLEHFNKNCTACSLCITACPNGVLQPAIREYGLAGMMQPVMDYHKASVPITVPFAMKSAPPEHLLLCCSTQKSLPRSERLLLSRITVL